MFELRIAPERLIRPLLAVFAVLLTVHVGLLFVRIQFARDYIYGLAPRFDFDRAISVPDWYTGILLLVAALFSILAATAAAKLEPRQAPYWRVLAAILLLLSFDEIASVHAAVSGWLSGVSYPSYLGWLFLYAPMAGLVGLGMVPFLLRLPRSTSAILILSGLAVVTGAGGFEIVATKVAEAVVSAPVSTFAREDWVHVKSDWAYVLVAAAGESFEMCGLCAYIFGVTKHLSRLGVEFRVSF